VTTRMHVADDGQITVETWPGNQTGPCVRCHVPTRKYGRHGRQHCAECQQARRAPAPPPPRPVLPVPAPREPGPDREPGLTLPLVRSTDMSRSVTVPDFGDSGLLYQQVEVAEPGEPGYPTPPLPETDPWAPAVNAAISQIEAEAS
jgi:hypothetical protein